MSQRETAITQMLNGIEQGLEVSPDELLSLLYDELRGRAGQLMRAERRDHTLQPTALVHEAYMRVMRPGASFKSRLHFFNTAAQAMRRILIDHAVARGAVKRGAGVARKVNLEDVDLAAATQGADDLDIVALDEAMTELSKRSPRQARVVMLRFYAGVSEREIAEMLEVNEKTVRRDWATAKLWLYDAMNRD
jgi:RNA polymerase sigma factor (TIGR02999 family)